MAEPEAEKHAEEKPAAEKPTAEELPPGAVEPALTESAADQPLSAEPVTEQPATSRKDSAAEDAVLGSETADTNAAGATLPAATKPGAPMEASLDTDVMAVDSSDPEGAEAVVPKDTEAATTEQETLASATCEPELQEPREAGLEIDKSTAEESGAAVSGTTEMEIDDPTTDKPQEAPEAGEPDVKEKSKDRNESEAANRRAGLNNKPAWMSRGIGVNKEFFGEVRGDLMKPGLTKADLEKLEKSVPTGPDPFGDVFRENVNISDEKKLMEADAPETDEPMVEEPGSEIPAVNQPEAEAAEHDDDAEDDGPDYDPFADEPASSEPAKPNSSPEDKVDQRDDADAANRRAGLNNKPAWMSRGIGVNKEFFGEVRGDLMKPGLTKADLERLKNSKPTGPDPFGDVFRENVKAPSLAEPSEAVSKASVCPGPPPAPPPPGTPLAPPPGPPAGPPPPSKSAQSKSAPQSKSVQQSKSSGHKRDKVQSKTGQQAKSGPKAALDSLPVKMPPAKPKYSDAHELPSKPKAATSKLVAMTATAKGPPAVTPKLLPAPEASHPVPMESVVMPMEIDMQAILGATTPGFMDIGATLPGTLPGLTPDLLPSMTMPGALPDPLTGLIPTVQETDILQQQMTLVQSIGGLPGAMVSEAMAPTLITPLPTGIPPVPLLPDGLLLPDSLPPFPGLMGQVGMPTLPMVTAPLPTAPLPPLPLGGPPLPLGVPPLPVGMPDLSGISTGLPVPGLGIMPDLMPVAPSLEFVNWEMHLSPQGVLYYHCEATGESRWERPSGPADIVLGGASLARSASTSPAEAPSGPEAVKAQIGEPESTETIGRTGWLRVETEKGFKYFFHKKKKMTSWTCPKEIEKEVAALDGALGFTPAEDKPADGSGEKKEDAGQAAAEGEPEDGAAKAEEGGSAPSRPTKAERLEAQERQKEEEQRVSKEKQRLLNFKQLLLEKGVKPFDKYDTWLPKLIHDSRFTAIPGQKERKALFEALAKKLDAERRKLAAEKKRGGREAFRQLMKKAEELDMLNERSLHKVQQAMEKRFGSDPGWTTVPPRERERTIKEAYDELEKKRSQSREAANKDFRALILVALRGKEEKPPRWRDIERRIQKEDQKRWDAIESAADREKMYEQVVKEIREALKKKQRRQRQDQTEVDVARKKARLEESEETLHSLFAERIKNPFTMDWDDVREMLGDTRAFRKCGLDEGEREKIWEEYKQGAIETRRQMLVQHLKDTPADVIAPDMTQDEVFRKALDSSSRKAFAGLEADVVESAYQEWRNQAYEAAVSVCRKWLRTCEHFRGTENINPAGGPEFEMLLERLSKSDVRFRRLNGRPSEQTRLVRARLEELRELRKSGRSGMDEDDD